MHNDNRELSDLMKMVGLKLNLQDHYVQNVLISGPGDIEGHIGNDGKFYVVDFGLIWCKNLY